jgi:hypothetical protein
MEDMTEEEYDALDELLTRTTPKLTGIPGVFAKQKKQAIVVLDDVSADWLKVVSNTTHKSSTEIIGELVREKIAASFA